MSEVLSQDEVRELAGGYKRPGDQLRELHRLGFWRARVGRVSGQVILERAHYHAVSSGMAEPEGGRRRPSLRLAT